VRQRRAAAGVDMQQLGHLGLIAAV